MQVQETKDYRIFKKIRGNRPLNPKHLKDLTESISEDNLLKANPIIVNENFGIIDGQHRLEVAKKLGLSIYYIVVEFADIQQVQRLNNAMKRWTMEDYLNSYIAQGNKNYETLDWFCKKYDLTISLGIMLLSPDNVKKFTGLREFKIGDFVPYDVERAEKIANVISELRPHCEGTVYNDREFVRAIIRLVEKNGVTAEMVIKKLDESGKIIERNITTKDYIRQIEDIVNFKRKSIIRFNY